MKACTAALVSGSKTKDSWCSVALAMLYSEPNSSCNTSTSTKTQNEVIPCSLNKAEALVMRARKGIHLQCRVMSMLCCTSCKCSLASHCIPRKPMSVSQKEVFVEKAATLTPKFHLSSSVCRETHDCQGKHCSWAY